MTMAASLSIPDAAKSTWEAIVVGAGPAGAVVACELGRLGVRTLLVDRAAFPRWKVCGSCLLQPGLAILRQLGLDQAPEFGRAIPLTDLRLSVRGVHATIPLTGGVVISRELLDTALIQAAIENGVQFFPETMARLHQKHPDFREVMLQQSNRCASVRTRIVVVADGLGGQFIAREPGVSVRVRKASRIGAGCAFMSDSFALRPGTIEMTCGNAGYVGLVRLEDGRINCAAALNHSALGRDFGPAAAAAQVLKEAGLNPPAELLNSRWRGTSPLTRSLSRPWADRLFVVGDAAGYLEPFTGEGMSVSLASAKALAPLVYRATQRWDNGLGREWASEFSRVAGSNLGLLRTTSILSRHPRVASGIVAIFSICPALAAPLERLINRKRIGGGS